MNKKVLSPEDINDLEKGLTTLGFNEEEIQSYIQKAKAVPENEEGAEGAPEGKKEPENEEGEGTIADKTQEGEGGEGGDEKEALRKEYEGVNKRKAEIEKALGIETADIKKSIDAPGANEDIMKAFGTQMEERFNDIQKSITEQVETQVNNIKDHYDEIIKGLQTDIEKIGNQPIGLKSVFSKANFMQKSIGGDDEQIADGGRELSITNDKDDLIKAMQTELGNTDDADVKEMLSAAISDYTISRTPNTHGSKGLVYVSKKQNITLKP